MIKRMAFLIAAPPPNSASSRVFDDLNSMQAFLHSPVGGAWGANEIQTFKNPSFNEVTLAIGNGKAFDYTLIYFAGQGELKKGKLPWAEIHALLSSGEEISERMLNPASPSCLMILDCSHQGLMVPQDGSVSNQIEVYGNSAGADDASTIYAESLSRAEKGLVKAYSIINRPAAPTSKSFTWHFLRESAGWSEGKAGVLSVGEAVDLVKKQLSKEDNNQRVEYLPGRRQRDFPFAIGRKSES